MEQADRILELLRQGDKRGLELLFRSFYRPLVMYALKFVAHQEEAEDIVQEVFIRFWEKNSFQMVEHYLRSYLYQSVRNRCMDELGKMAEVKLESMDSLWDFADSEMPDETDWNTRIDDIYREIGKLPDRTREIFVAVVMGGKRYKEVAGDLNISVNTVKTTLSRALVTLRSNLNDRAYSLILLFL